MPRLIVLAALAAFASFSGAAHVARADQPVRCEVTREGKKTVSNASNAEACAKMGGTVVATKDANKDKEKAEKPKKTD
jgi:hypothetical protein